MIPRYTKMIVITILLIGFTQPSAGILPVGDIQTDIMGTTLDFEGFGGPIGTYYSGVTFSTDWNSWDSSGNTRFPPHSGTNVAYTHSLDNSINFDTAIDYVSIYVINDYSMPITLYTYDQFGREVGSTQISANADNEFVEFQSMFANIALLKFNVSEGGYGAWTIDDLSYSSTLATPNYEQFIDFEGFGGPIGTYYQDITFSSDWNSWDSFGNTRFPPHSGTNVAYTHSLDNFINLDTAVDYVSVYVINDYSQPIILYAFDQFGREVGNSEILPYAENQFVEISNEMASIVQLKFNVTEGGYGSWTIDDLYLSQIKGVPEYEQFIDFEGFGGPVGTYYSGVTFSSDWNSWDSSGNSRFPPHSGTNVAYTHSLDNSINLDTAVDYVSVYVINDHSQPIILFAYDQFGREVGNSEILPYAENQFIEIQSSSSNIVQLKFNVSESGYGSWTIDDLYIRQFFQAPEFEQFIDFEGTSGPIGTHYSDVNFSSDWNSWDSSGNTRFPPHSGTNVAYTHSLNNYITLDTAIDYVSVFVINDYSQPIILFGYDQFGREIGSTEISPYAENQFIELQSYSANIVMIKFNVSESGYGSWTIDDLYVSKTLPAPSFENYMDFEGFGGPIGTHYSGVTFSTDWNSWDSSGNTRFPPHSGTNVAYTHSLDNLISLDTPVNYVSVYVINDHSAPITLHAYNQYGQEIVSSIINAYAENQFTQLATTSSDISSIWFEVSETGYGSWTIDDLFVCSTQGDAPIEIDSTSPTFLDFTQSFSMEYTGELTTVFWEISDESPDSYEIYLNNQLLSTNIWSESPLIVTYDVIVALGDNNVSLVAIDENGNSAMQSVFISTVDTIAPTLTGLDDISILKGDSVIVKIHVFDLNPGEIHIFINGESFYAGFWLNGEFSFTLEGTEVGQATGKVILYDTSFNNIEQTFLIEVYEDTTTTDTTDTTTSDPEDTSTSESTTVSTDNISSDETETNTSSEIGPVPPGLDLPGFSLALTSLFLAIPVLIRRKLIK
ncbi:MAG: hypothetical protein INQ03_16070 [Candidatus Heimdallarchaeota archaeon]|nr:hypothetical protein [Candidatus Heimdallarchaeota archaeon]